MPRFKRLILPYGLFPHDKISINNSEWHIMKIIIYPAHKPGQDCFSLNFVVSGSILQFYAIMVKTIITGFLLLVSFIGFSQTVQLPLNADNSELFVRIDRSHLKAIDSLYVVESGSGNNFIGGREYRGYYFRSDNKPILFYGRERTASLVYKGRTYSDLVLQYDTYLDEVIYTVYNKWDASQVALNSDNISRFDLCFDGDTLTFRYISDELEPSFNLDDGYYEVVHDGKCKYIIKHESTHYMRSGVDEYAYKPTGYVMTGDGFNKITSRKQFVNMFGSNSKEIKQFIGSNGIRIRKAGKYQIENILKYYEGITTGNH
jgi:hypothetical protein